MYLYSRRRVVVTLLDQETKLAAEQARQRYCNYRREKTRKAFGLLACGWVLLSGCGPDIEAVSASPLKVGLQNVIEIAVAQAVNGTTSAGQPDEAVFMVFADSGYAAAIELRTDGEERGLDGQGFEREVTN